MTSSSTSAQAWRELTDISRPRVRVCRAREAGEGEAVAAEEGEEEVVEVTTEAGVREDGAEAAGTGAAEVRFCYPLCNVNK